MREMSTKELFYVSQIMIYEVLCGLKLHVENNALFIVLFLLLYSVSLGMMF